MKTTFLFTAILISVFIGKSTFAGNTDSVQICQIPNDIKKILFYKMDFPKEAKESKVEGVVSTCFFITPEGKLKVYCINGHPLLTSYVQEKIESFKCCQPSASIVNKHMLVRFNFENQN